MKADKGALLVGFCALLTLGSVSIFCCPVAHAGNSAAKPVPAAQAPKAEVGDDLDDDRAEHWGVPAIGREERRQIAALGVALLCAGFGGARRRIALRKQVRHG